MAQLAVMPALSEVCAEAREDSALTRTQIAAQLGKAESAVWRFEHPKRGWPAGHALDDTVQAYADLCQVDPYEIWQRAIDRARTIDRTARMDAAKQAASKIGEKRKRSQ